MLFRSLYRLRKLLGVDGAVKMSGGRVSFDRSVVWIDAFALKDRIKEMERCLGKEDFDRLFPLFDTSFELYAGPFLAGEEEPPEVLFRERIEQSFLKLLSGAGEYLEKKEQWREAEAIFRRGLRIAPVQENLYRHVMHCCERQGRFAEAVSVYKSFEKKLALLSGIAPGPQIKSLYSSIKRKSS